MVIIIDGYNQVIMKIMVFKMKKSIITAVITAMALVLAGCGDTVHSVSRNNDIADICFSAALPDSLTYSTGRTVTTPYGSFVPIEHILQVNSYFTVNHTVLSSEDTVIYITESGDRDKAAEIMNKLLVISDTICGGMTDDKAKANALAMWVGENLIYDRDAASTLTDYDPAVLENILDHDMKTTCEGFSNFFSALCHCQGIYCLNMRGGSSSGGWLRSELENAPANHSWNGITLDGLWYYVDCTWISDKAYENGAITGGEDIKPFYALMSFEEMSVEHRIDRCEHRCYRIP